MLAKFISTIGMEVIGLKLAKALMGMESTRTRALLCRCLLTVAR
jgi:hypothetical protein